MKNTFLTTIFFGILFTGKAQTFNPVASSIANAEGTTIISSGVNAGQITAGRFTGTSDFNPSPSATYNLSAGAGTAMYVQSLGGSNEFYWAISIPGATPAKMVAQEAIYIIGTFSGTVDFDPNPSVTNNITSAGMSDCFIMKINGTNGALIWVKRLGGTDNDTGISLSGIMSGSVYSLYLTGTFKATADLDPTPTSTNNVTSSGGTDIFVVKLNDAGTYQWSKRTGGTGNDYPTDIQATATDITVSGGFAGTVDFNPNAGVNNLTVLNYINDAAFLFRWNSSSTYQWARLFDQPNGWTRINCILVTATNIYIAGDIFDSFYYSTTSGTSTSITPNNLNAAFYAKLDAVGFAAEWVQLVDNPPGTPQSQETITDIISDGSNTPAIYMVGVFLGTTSFTPNGPKQATIASTGGTNTFFIFKIYGTGAYQWGFALTNAEGGYGRIPQIGISWHGGYNHICTTAKFHGTQDFDFNGSVYPLTSVGPTYYDAFVAKWSDPY